MFRRGIASIVVTVLVILLAIVGTGIVFVTVNSFIKDGTDNEDIIECLSLDLSAFKCEIDVTINITNVSVVRGPGDANLSEIRLVFESSNGSISIDRDASNFGELETRIFSFEPDEVSQPFNVDLAGILESGSICPLTGFEITCSGVRGDRDDGDDNNDTGDNNIYTGWIVLNGGNPVDAEDGFEGEGLPAYDLRRDRTIVDNNGNLIYLYYGSDPYLSINSVWRDLRIGRLTANTGWEILGTNGWSSSSNVEPVSFGGTLRHIMAMKLIFVGNNVFGITSSNIHLGGKGLDIHGGIFHFNNLANPQFWAPDGFMEHLGQSLLANWGGAGWNNFDFDFNDQNTVGILVAKEKNNVNKPVNLIAARYDSSSTSWKNWKADGWTGTYSSAAPFARDYEFLSFYTDSDSAEPTPRISHISGTDQYVVTYVDYDTPQYGLRAVLYDDSESSWKVWDGDSWNTDAGASTRIVVTNSGNKYANLQTRKRIEFQGEIYDFYAYPESGKTFYEAVKYDSSSTSWDVEIVSTENREISFSEYNQEVISESGDLLWITYKNDSGIVLKTFDGNNWYDNGTIYESSTAYPYALEFFNNLPVLFYVEKSNGMRRLFAVSLNNSIWDGQSVRSQRSSPVQIEKLDDSIGSEAGQWDLDVFYSDSQEYGPGYCGHMAIDESRVYCPGLPVFDDLVGLYPLDYNSPADFSSETAHIWLENGSGTDYFFGGVGGIAVDNIREKVYVTDRLMQAVGVHLSPNSRINIFDKSLAEGNLVDGSYVPRRMTLINGEKIAFASDVAVDEANGFLYVVESGKNRLVKFDVVDLQSGLPTLLGTIGETELNFPMSVDVDNSGNVYAVDSNNHRVVKYNSAGSKVDEWGEYGREEGEFIYPYSVAVDKVKDYVYVSDPYNRRLQVFDLEGNFVYQFGEWDTSDSRFEVYNFSHITGVVAQDNSLYVGTFSQKSVPGPREGMIVKFLMNFP